MSETPDFELLEQFARNQSEAAFAELVERHLGLVYSAAFRKTENPQQAEDIAQAVFIILARKAGSLGPKTVLPGWLYHTTRLTAANLQRAEMRRIRREQEAFMQSMTNESAPDALWREMSPLLEDAIAGLRASDRDAIVLRFFQNRSMAEVGAALGANENAAKMRVNRALEKLRKFFSKRGVVSTTAVIAGVISSHSVQAAPVGLAKSVTAAGLANGATASASTLTLMKGALKLMAWTKAQTAIVIGVGALLVAGTICIKVKHAAAFEHEAWQRKWNPVYLKRLPPQVEILPAIASRRDNGIAHAGGDGLMGLGNGIALIVEDAYGVNVGRTVFSVPVPQGNYDFFSNIRGNAGPALQQELKKKFGLSAWVELIQTNVLVLTVQKQGAAGLKRSRPSESPDGNEEWDSRSILGVNQPISYLDGIIEDYLRVPVVDQTGLAGRYDFHLKGDSTDDGFKSALQEQLGLELSPANIPVEMLVLGTNPPPVPEALTDADFSPRAGSDLQGFWVGTVGRGRYTVHVQMKIAEASDGSFRADAYCPDAAGTNRIPAQVSYDGTTVKAVPMEPVLGLGMFEGRLRNGGNEIAGDWIQNGAYAASTTLRRADYSEYRTH